MLRAMLMFVICFSFSSLFAMVPVDSKGNHRVFGVIQSIFSWDTETGENSFSCGKTAFGFDGRINEYFGYRFIISLNYKTFEYTAFDFYGKIFLPFGEIRIGQFKMPFSMERLISFPKRDFIKNAIATGLVQSRDFGIGFYSNKPSWIEYNFAVINGEGLNRAESNKYKDVIGRLVFVYKGFRFGGAVYFGKSVPDSSVIKKNRYNLQFEFKKSDFHIRSEAVKTEDGNIKGKDIYAQIGYKIKINKPYLQGIEPLLRWEFYDPSIEEPENAITRWTFGINFYIKGYNVRFQCNYVRDIFENKEFKDKILVASQFMF